MQLVGCVEALTLCRIACLLVVGVGGRVFGMRAQPAPKGHGKCAQLLAVSWQAGVACRLQWMRHWAGLCQQTWLQLAERAV